MASRTRAILVMTASLPAAGTVPAGPASGLLGGLLGGGVNGHYRDFGDQGGFRNILPAGQDGSLNTLEALGAQLGIYPAHVRDQYAPYHDLGRAGPGLTEDQLGRYFKDASFGAAPADIGRSYSPFPNVTVVRDKSSSVPHIFGTTRKATMQAQGYTAAEGPAVPHGRPAPRGPGPALGVRGPVAGQPGPGPGPAGRRALHRGRPHRPGHGAGGGRRRGGGGGADLAAYSEGVNAYITQALLDPLKLPAEYPALQQVPRAWKPEDTVAVAAYVGGQLGRGGGGELGRRRPAQLRARAPQ